MTMSHTLASISWHPLAGCPDPLFIGCLGCSRLSTRLLLCGCSESPAGLLHAGYSSHWCGLLHMSRCALTTICSGGYYPLLSRFTYMGLVNGPSATQQLNYFQQMQQWHDNPLQLLSFLFAGSKPLLASVFRITQWLLRSSRSSDTEWPIARLWGDSDARLSRTSLIGASLGLCQAMSSKRFYDRANITTKPTYRELWNALRNILVLHK